MPDPDPKKITELEDRLDSLVRTQIDFQKEVLRIRSELAGLKRWGSNPPPASAAPDRSVTGGGDENVRPPRSVVSENETTTGPPPRTNTEQPPSYRPPVRPVEKPAQNFGRTESVRDTPSKRDPVSQFFSKYTESARADLEKFIGENLISKIGILVLIIGVGIGVKYSIDNNLISPLTRVALAYVFAFGLIGLAIKLKAKYHNFSAALISGGMAMMYFVTYFAYSAYGLIGQGPAFGLMIMLTLLTVAAALVYDRQVIAHIGLVGAYAVPFLLSSNSGNYLALFVYMAIVNAGILAVSIKKYWRPIFYTASAFTWLIFLGWFAGRYSPNEHFGLALVFLGIFFAIFLATGFVQAILHSKRDNSELLISSLVTIGIFYAFSLGISATDLTSPQFWTFFVYLAGWTTALLAFVNLGLPAAVSANYRRPVFYVAAGFTWIIYLAWFVSDYSPGTFFALALTFLGVFAAVFLAVVIYIFRDSDSDDIEPLIAALVTVGLFFAFCFAISHSGLGPLQLWTFFTYLTIATLAVLLVALQFFGKFLIYLAFASAWAIYGAWYGYYYQGGEQFTLAVVFAAAFFTIFYVTVLFYRLVRESFSLIENAGLVLSNSFLFYGFGYSILNGNEATANYLGLYTAGHSAMHLGVAHFVNKLRSSAVDVVQVLTILTLTFASIAIPVQFDGNQVTMIWSVEGALLFWLGRSRHVRLFEFFSYPVMLLAAGSMFLDWITTFLNRTSYASEFNLQPFANGNFVTALVFIAAFAVIFAVNRDKENEAAIDENLVKPFGYVIAGLAIFALYNAFRGEIGNYFHLQSVAIRESGADPFTSAELQNLDRFNAVWQIDYTIVFLAAMAFVNLRKVRSVLLGLINAGLGVAVLALFATAGMILFYELRVNYVEAHTGLALISVRYLSYAASAILMFALYRYRRDTLLEARLPAPTIPLAFDATLYTFGFIILSCEVVNLMARFGIPDGTKLGLSIFWGLYALMLIVLGIAWNKKHLRIAAICILAVILAKLFFYDVTNLGTIPRTILFVSLGLTLLLISFLYNKYKAVIFKFGEEGEEEV